MPVKYAYSLQQLHFFLRDTPLANGDSGEEKLTKSCVPPFNIASIFYRSNSLSEYSYSDSKIAHSHNTSTAMHHRFMQAQERLKIQTHFNCPCTSAPLWVSIESFVVHYTQNLSTAESRLSPPSTVVSFFLSLSIWQFYDLKTKKFPTYLHHAHPKELSVALCFLGGLYLVSAPGVPYRISRG